MLRISKLTDYGSVILTFMARQPDCTYSAARLSESLHLPKTTVSKLLKVLQRNELVKSSRGKSGGYHLARPAEKISLAQIISALEGPIALTQCSLKKNLCQIEEHCDIRPSWQSVNRAIYDSLSQVSLEVMLNPADRAQPVKLPNY